LENLTKGGKQFWEVYKGLPRPKQIGIAGSLAVVILGFAALLLFTGKTEYQVLFSNLNQTDAAQVVDKLKEQKIPYQLGQNGAAILIPVEKLYETRLALAGQGLPKGGGVGFEVFDETRMGATEFVQRINYQRAIQGELSRTINEFKEVVSSRVHIVTPKESLFVEEQKKPSASVVLQLKEGASLQPTQVQAIVNLVAASVEGLEAERVSVVDTTGRVLYDKKDQSDLAGLTQTQAEHKRKVESELVGKVQSLMDRVVGPGRAVAKVSAELDFDREQRVEEQYDPDVTVLRSSQSNEENQEGQGLRAVGSPDDQFKITAGQTGSAGEKSSYNRTNETLNYEINKVSRQVVKAAGQIKRLSVAVVIDGKYEEKPGEGGKPTRTFVPRSEQDLARFATLIRSAVGYNEKRGDTIEVATMPFEPAAPVEAAPTWLDYLQTYGRLYGRTALVVLLGVLFFLLVVRPMVKWSGQQIRETMVEARKLPTPEEQMAGELEDLRRKMGPREKAAMLVEKEIGRASCRERVS
jgi:flagellar M-ring protein FliF